MTPSIPRTTSASQLVTYSLCPRRYGLQYAYGFEPEFRPTNLILGSAVHSAIGWWFEERLQGRGHRIDEAEDVLMADLLAAETCEPVRWKTHTPASLEEEGRRLVRLYLTEYGELPVAAVEQEIDVGLENPETGEVFGRSLKGYFDLVLEDHAAIELKTSSRGWSEEDLVRHLQLGAYAFAWNDMHGGPSDLRVHVIVKLKREPRVETYRIDRGEPATRWWIQAAGSIERAIEARHFPPSPGPLCRECPFESACAGWTDDEPVRPTTKVDGRAPRARRLSPDALVADL